MSWFASALISSIWVDTAIGIMAIAIRSLQSKPQARYVTLMIGLALMVVAPALLAPMGHARGLARIAASNDTLILIWAIGAGLCLIRTLIGAASVRSMLKESLPCLSQPCLDKLAEIAKQVGLRKLPEIRVTTDQWTPCAVGIFRSLVLIPVGVMSRLGPDQLAAILAHEAAHIRRWDYLANLLQSIVEALLFFHPAAWLISHLARVERELCCDDLVIAAGSDRRSYATALAEIARSRRPLAPAAASVGVPFRIARLLGATRRAPLCAPQSFVGTCALCLAVIPAFLFFSESDWTVSLPQSELPRSWVAKSIAHAERDQIEIRLTTSEGDGHIVLDRPTEVQPATWFEVNGYRFEGTRDSAGNVRFVRAGANRTGLKD